MLCKYDNSNIDRNIRYIRSIAYHANPNKLLIKLFEKSLNIDNEITDSYLKHPHTVKYDCSKNFAPITVFDINDMKKFI